MPILSWASKQQDLRRTLSAQICALHELACHGDKNTENLLIQGDNLPALKTLSTRYVGQVKLCYIDPPFNTGTDFENYNDNFKHADWLKMMYPLLHLIREMLSEDGSIWVSIDHREFANLKIIMDEVFGEKNHVNIITNTTAPSGFKTTSKTIFAGANYILAYAKKRSIFAPKKHFIKRDFDSAYSSFLENREDHYSKWKWCSLKNKYAQQLGHESFAEMMKKTKEIFGRPLGEIAINDRLGVFAVENASKVFRTARLTGGALKKRQETIDKSRAEKNKIFVHSDDDQAFLILNGEQIIFYKKTLSLVDGELSPSRPITDVWTDISMVGISGEGGVTLNNGKKPERLIQRIIDIASNPGDLVMDCFLGSGTTAAVAHKMGRRWFGIEKGEQAETLCVKRLCAVVSGMDNSGISKLVKWKGGGGFRFLRLGNSIFDEKKRVSADVDFNALASYIWFSETKRPLNLKEKTPFLGEHQGMGYALLYNGVIKKNQIDKGNVLNVNTLALIRSAAPEGFSGKIVIYAYGNRIIEEGNMRKENIEFRQIPFFYKK